MELSLKEIQEFECIKHSFYTEKEKALLYQMENGLVKTLSHDEVMDDLQQKLNLNEI